MIVNQMISLMSKHKSRSNTAMRILLLAVLVLAKWAMALFASQASNGVQPLSVLDLEGRELQAGVHYYIRSSDGAGGGLVLSRRDFMCPMNVVQLNSNESNGIPLTFVPFNKSETNVVEGRSKVRIGFLAATICVQSTDWRVGEVDRTTRRRYITTGLVGREPASYWFSIERMPDGVGYKIVSGPEVCVACDMVCGHVGIFNEQGKRWLALSEVPLSVVFKRVL